MLKHQKQDGLQHDHNVESLAPLGWSRMHLWSHVMKKGVLYHHRDNGISPPSLPAVAWNR